MRKAQDNMKLGAALRRLAAAGCMGDFSAAIAPDESAEIDIHLVGGFYESRLSELTDGRNRVYFRFGDY